MYGINKNMKILCICSKVRCDSSVAMNHRQTLDPWAVSPARREVGLGFSQLDCKTELHAFPGTHKATLYLRRCVRNKNLRSPFTVTFFISLKASDTQELTDFCWFEQISLALTAPGKFHHSSKYTNL